MADGVLQVGGLASLIAGIAMNRTQLERIAEPRPPVGVLPLRLGKDGMGITLVGTM